MERNKKAAKLDKIAKEISRCRTCKINKVGKAVPGEGSPNAKIVFIGEAPGKKESEEGRPFIGRAGSILRRLIRGCGLKEEDVYITSAVKYLPKYLTPKPSDIEHGRKHLFSQLRVIKPKIVVLLGNVAVLAVLTEKFAIAKVHGKIIKRDGVNYFIAYHPAAMLHNPNVRKDIKSDFRKLKRIL
ncbi:MAG: uracil-DNA glycosylase [Candidatus Paceibacterota bacterium]|jgi:DNA polymerase